MDKSNYQPWHFDSDLSRKFQEIDQSQKQKPFLLMEGELRTFEKLINFIKKIPFLVIGHVDVIYNKSLTSILEGKIELMSQRQINNYVKKILENKKTV